MTALYRDLCNFYKKNLDNENQKRIKNKVEKVYYNHLLNTSNLQTEKLTDISDILINGKICKKLNMPRSSETSKKHTKHRILYKSKERKNRKRQQYILIIFPFSISNINTKNLLIVHSTRCALK